MKLAAPRHALAGAFQAVQHAVPAHDQRPILRNVKATAADDHCTLQATNQEFGICLELGDVPVEEPGAALFPANRLMAILREAPDEQLVIETTTDASWIRGNANEFELPGEDPSEFPDLPDFPDDSYHELSASALRELIRRTSFAVAAENARYAMTGVLWELEGYTARLVATDGRRLAVAEGAATPQRDHNTKGRTCVVPSRAMQLLERNLQGVDEPVRVRFRPNEALFRTGRATLHSRLVEGRYPAYREVIPKKATTTIPLIAGPFQTALRQAAIMADDDNHKVALHFTPGTLTLKARGAETGRSQVEAPIDYDGKVVDITFDARLLLDLLRVLPTEAALVL